MLKISLANINLCVCVYISAPECEISYYNLKEYELYKADPEFNWWLNGLEDIFLMNN